MYGPYLCSDGRLRVIIDGVTLSYPRLLMEKKLGRKLFPSEHVHHIDGNKENNSEDNLEVIDAKKHLREHATKYIQSDVWNCAHCGKDFEVTAKQIGNRRREQRRGKATSGPYCSKHCSGYAGKPS